MSLVVYAVIAVLSGQELAVSKDCLDDNLTNRCDAERRAGSLALFSAPTIEQDADSGAEVYRVLSVDGYGQDLPVIAFERRPGSGPQAVVYAEAGRKLAAPIGRELWGRVQREARFADQQVLPARPEGDEDEVFICLHSWVVTVEMANSYVDRSRQVPVRRRTEDTCSNGLTTQVAFGLADLAMDAFPQCETLDENNYRSVAHRLSACSALSGDIPAAAEVQNHLDRVERRGRHDETPPDFWRRYIGLNASPAVSWNGEMVTGRLHGRDVPDFLAAKVTALGVTLIAQSVTGVGAREVVVTGALLRVTDAPQSSVGAYSQTWEFSPPAQNWVLKSMTATLNATTP